MNSSPQLNAMNVVLVMPCLNEAGNLTGTCSSLGFGSDAGRPTEQTSLVIVDNGSEDDTWKVAEEIQRNSHANSVHMVSEPTRGFVPARHCGNLFAQELASLAGWNAQDVLVLQVDADCQYLPGYITAMRRAAESQHPNVMIEACIGYPTDFKDKYPEYVNICDRTDIEFQKLFPRSLTHDDVPVDAVCGYRLADYFSWGCHRREFNAGGEEIYAETTRMFMRARIRGAERFRVSTGLALHSARKAIENPALHLATGGFPREASWNRTWQANYRGPENLEELCAHIDHPEVLKAVRIREEHLLALFGVLPLHVDRALGQPSDKTADSEQLTRQILPLLPIRTRADLESQPGLLIADVFELISKHGTQLLNQGRQIISKARS